MFNKKLQVKALCYLWMVFLGLLSGCKSTLNVEGTFPVPVVNQLPLRVGVVMSPEFRAYQYIETNEQRSEWEITIGNAQVDLMNTVFGAMFSQSVNIASVAPNQTPKFDLFIEPNLESFQYSVPRETRGKMYEVWLKYNIRVFDEQGQIIADWILTSYGKTPTAFFKSNEQALNDALVIALRDLGAGLSIRFINLPEISQWLNSKNVALNNKAFDKEKKLKG
ncbi:hypothetical protein [Thalassotalea ganghwensis]